RDRRGAASTGARRTDPDDRNRPAWCAQRTLDRPPPARWRPQYRSGAGEWTSRPSRSSPARPLTGDADSGRCLVTSPSAADVLAHAAALRSRLGETSRDAAVQARYAEAGRIARRATKAEGARFDFDQRIDRVVTSPVFGLPIMAVILAAIFWLTVAGANVPSSMLADALFWIEGQGVAAFEALNAPWWLTGLLWNGI